MNELIDCIKDQFKPDDPKIMEYLNEKSLTVFGVKVEKLKKNQIKEMIIGSTGWDVPFTYYKLRPLTLAEREECSNSVMYLKTVFTQALNWMRYGLIGLKGKEINKENFDEEVNDLQDPQLFDIAADIRERNQFQDKKKS